MFDAFIPTSKSIYMGARVLDTQLLALFDICISS
jgi:hypothetical protein